MYSLIVPIAFTPVYVMNVQGSYKVIRQWNWFYFSLKGEILDFRVLQDYRKINARNIVG